MPISRQTSGPLAVTNYAAAMYLANSGAPTHTASGWQKVADGGGTDTWTTDFDIRPAGVAAQVDLATNKRIDIRKSGLYELSASATFAAIATGNSVGVSIYKNGASFHKDIRSTGAGAAAAVTTSTVRWLDAGDYIELWAYQTDTLSEAYTVSENSLCRLACTYVGSATGVPVSAHCRVSRVAALSHGTSATYIAVSWDTEKDDNSTMFAPTSTDITVLTAGVYSIEAVLTYSSASTAGIRVVRIVVGGTPVRNAQTQAATAGVTGVGASVSIKLAAGDVITVEGYQNSGASLTYTVGDAYMGCSVTKIGDYV